MSINIPRGSSDPTIEEIIITLEAFEKDNPNARIDIYRQNSVSIRIRIISPDFKPFNRVERSKYVWKYLNTLDEEIQSDISSVILLTPDETKHSFANLEFESPVPSSL